MSYVGSGLTLVVLVIVLLSGVLSVARDIQRMYKPPSADNKQVFWAFVRIAFVISAAVLWYDAFSSMKGRESDLHQTEGALLLAQGEIESLKEQNQSLRTHVTSAGSTTPPIQVIIPPSKRDELRDETKDLMANLINLNDSLGKACPSDRKDFRPCLRDYVLTQSPWSALKPRLITLSTRIPRGYAREEPADRIQRAIKSIDRDLEDKRPEFGISPRAFYDLVDLLAEVLKTL